MHVPFGGLDGGWRGGAVPQLDSGLVGCGGAAGGGSTMTERMLTFTTMTGDGAVR